MCIVLGAGRPIEGLAFFGEKQSSPRLSTMTAIEKDRTVVEMGKIILLPITKDDDRRMDTLLLACYSYSQYTYR
jgi:hypothetical protein